MLLKKFRVIVGSNVFKADTDGAVMPCGGNFLAIGGFSFLVVTTLVETAKPICGGNFSAVGGFSFLGGNDFGGGSKTKIWR